MINATSGTLITFDYEGSWGMPHDASYDLHASTNVILDVLERHGVSAMFFVVGRLVEDEPELIGKIAGRGHAIGLHGYRHERLDTLTPWALQSLQVELERVCVMVEQISSVAPVAFRAPYLLWPKFADPRVSSMLVKLGFRWMSNREIRFPEELFRPDRVPWKRARDLASMLGALTDTRPFGSVMITMLNARHIWNDPALGTLRKRAHWLLGERQPFERSGLVEVAIAAPLDCDLLGLPKPTEDTSEAMSNFATECLIAGRQRRGDPYVLSFHDWIIGTANRAAVLNDVLEVLCDDGPMLNARVWLPQSGGRVA